MNHRILMLSLLGASMNLCAQRDSVVALDNVVVTGSRQAIDIRHLPNTVNVIDRATLTANQQQNVLPTLLQQVPALFVTSRAMMGYGVSGGSAGGINMRGISGGAGQLLVLIDGHPQYQGIFGHPISDSYQTLMADRVEVLRGPASMLYGSQAMGGVINIVTRSMRHDGASTHLNLGAGSYGTFQSELGSRFRKGRFSGIATAQYGRSDNHRSRMGFEQYGGFAKVGYDINPHWNAYINADITHFNASNPGTVSAPLYDARQWITRGVVTAALENHYDRTSGALNVYDNFGRHKIKDGVSDPTAIQQRYFRSNDALIGVSWYQTTRLLSGNHTTVGIDYQHIYGKAYYTDIKTGETLATPNKQSGTSHRNEVAGYVDIRQDVSSWLTVDAGLRADHHSVTGMEWVPQAGVVVRPITSGQLKATVSKGFRNPSMREMYLYPPSNTDLEPERLMNYELAWTQSLLDGRLHYGANVYYLKGDNMIQTVMQEGKPRNVNTGEVKNYGFEVESGYRLSPHWSLTTNHSWLHLKNPIVGAPEYKGFIGGAFAHGPWSVNAGLQYIAGLYTAVGQTETKENFCLLNATVNYRLLKNLSLWLRGENLLAQRYEINAGFPMPRATFMGGLNLTL